MLVLNHWYKINDFKKFGLAIGWKNREKKVVLT